MSTAADLPPSLPPSVPPPPPSSSGASSPPPGGGGGDGDGDGDGGGGNGDTGSGPTPGGGAGGAGGASWLRQMRRTIAGIGNPVAIAAIGVMLLGALAMGLDQHPIIPLIVVGVLCILSWEHRWAQVLWYATLTAYVLWFLATSSEIWLPFFLALVAAYVLSPIVDWGERRLRNRFASVTVLFLLGIALVVLFNVFLLDQILATIRNIGERIDPQQIEESLNQLGVTIAEFLGFRVLPGGELSGEIATSVSSFLRQLAEVGRADMRTVFAQAEETLKVVGVILFQVLAFLIATFFLLLHWPRYTDYVSSYFSPERGQRLYRLSREIVTILRHYFQGYLALCLFVGVVFYVILAAFGHPYALLLALLIGVISIVPYIGPTVGLILAVLLTLTVPVELVMFDDPGAEVGYHLIAVLVAFGISRVLGDFVLTPLVVGPAVNVNPVMTLLVLFLVGNTFGILAMLFAVPLFAIARVVVVFIYDEGVPGFEWLGMLRPYRERQRESRKLLASESAESTTD